VREKSPAEKILELASLGDAFNFARPMMTDEKDAPDPGAMLLTVWSLKHVVWADVGVKRDETSFALVEKDPDEERGKRLCATGMLIQIDSEKTQFGKTFTGLLMNRSQELFYFITVGSSGTLVGRDWGRVCGVITGRHDYSNSGGGTGHAVGLVGMFDLPENKTIRVTP
jgi:hypothetical protein